MCHVYLIIMKIHLTQGGYEMDLLRGISEGIKILAVIGAIVLVILAMPANAAFF